MPDLNDPTVGGAQAQLSAAARPVALADDRGLMPPGRRAATQRVHVLWRMLCETAGRSAEVLALDVGDLDLANLRAKVPAKGAAHYPGHSLNVGVMTKAVSHRLSSGTRGTHKISITAGQFNAHMPARK